MADPNPHRHPRHLLHHRHHPRRRRLFQVPANADLFLTTLQHYRREGHYELHAFVVMPDNIPPPNPTGALSLAPLLRPPTNRREDDTIPHAPRLERRQTTGNFHFITFSCHNRQPLLATPAAKTTFLKVLEQIRQRHNLKIAGYVVMPEHVHLLTDEPPSLATILQVLKQTTFRYLKSPEEERFWLPRYYDFNVITHTKYLEKLRYIHRNPVARGLATTPEAYPWSSFRYYASHEQGPVHLESDPTQILRVPHP